VAQLVARVLWEHEVARSNRVAPTNKNSNPGVLDHLGFLFVRKQGSHLFPLMDELELLVPHRPFETVGEVDY
jgi:hypothetical protein